jgi:hypothetical protein
MAKFVTLVRVGVQAGVSDESFPEFGWGKGFLWRDGKRSPWIRMEGSSCHMDTEVIAVAVHCCFVDQNDIPISSDHYSMVKLIIISGLYWSTNKIIRVARGLNLV